MKSKTCTLLIIGAGPGGYVCGVRAGQLGLDTIVVEGKAPGGTCLNVGCIPSKALIHAADEFHKLTAANEMGISAGPGRIDWRQTQNWKNGIVQRLTGGVSSLLKKAKTRVIAGQAQIIDGKTVQVETDDGPLRITCKHLVIATGSSATELPFLPFGGKVISSTEALALEEVPKSLTIVGGGYIGLEIGTAMAKLGARVSIVEAADRVLPQYDAALTKPVETRLRALGIDLHLNAKAKRLGEGGALQIEAQDGAQSVKAEHVLVTVGRRPLTDGFGLESLGLTMSGPHIQIDSRCATSMQGVYAIGDVTGDPMLAHRAMAQGVVVAEHVAGLPTVWDKRAIPAVCFTDPEVVVVGALPSEATATALFPFAANGRAMSVERTDGFVRVVYDPQTELVLGLQAVGAGVAELAGEFALAIEMCATLRDIADTVHAHPTLGETVQESGHMALGHALHI
ncbi:MAG: dihydrolipoyl dehydrogenase [Pseudomonadota bacterium]